MLHAAEQNRSDVAEQRAHWHERLAGDSPARLVFVDGSGANTRITRWRDRSFGGQRLVTQGSTGTLSDQHSDCGTPSEGALCSVIR
jgi:hypothetical protein